jgi:hypothetical protein
LFLLPGGLPLPLFPLEFEVIPDGRPGLRLFFDPGGRPGPLRGIPVNLKLLTDPSGLPLPLDLPFCIFNRRPSCDSIFLNEPTSSANPSTNALFVLGLDMRFNLSIYYSAKIKILSDFKTINCSFDLIISIPM